MLTVLNSCLLYALYVLLPPSIVITHSAYSLVTYFWTWLLLHPLFYCTPYVIAPLMLLLPLFYCIPYLVSMSSISLVPRPHPPEERVWWLCAENSVFVQIDFR